MEHSSPSIETVADMAVLARALHIPQVDTPEIARQVVEAARYAPLGMRGMAGLSSGTDFDGQLGATERLEHLNEQVHITIMLESAEAFRHLDEILATPGIDAVTLGPTDLAQELGVFGTPRQTAVLDEHRHRLIAAAAVHGKDVAMLVDTLDDAARWIAAGVRIIAYSSDVAVLKTAYASAIQRLRGG